MKNTAKYFSKQGAQTRGFTVLEMRRTFLNDASLLVWARKNAGE